MGSLSRLLRWWRSCWAFNPCPDCGRHAPIYGYDYAALASQPGYIVTAARYRCPKGHYHAAPDPFGRGFVVNKFAESPRRGGQAGNQGATT
jgi:hypothetical protein